MHLADLRASSSPVLLRHLRSLCLSLGGSVTCSADQSGSSRLVRESGTAYSSSAEQTRAARTSGSLYRVHSSELHSDQLSSSKAVQSSKV